jgi:hypothetical protein
MEIKWEEPPPGGPGMPPKFAEFAQALRDNPGRWALYPGKATQATATEIKRARSSIFAPAGHFDAVSRDMSHPDKRRVYVRYVGPGGAA